MKNIILLLALLAFSSLNTYGQSEQEALEYLHKLTKPLSEFRSETWNVIKTTMSSRSSSMLDQKIKGITSKIGKTREQLSKEDGFYGDLSIKVAMKIFLRNAESILTEEKDWITNW